MAQNQMTIKTGDTCPKCNKARLYIRSSRRKAADWHSQYLVCPHCDHKQSVIVPASIVRKRTRT